MQRNCELTILMPCLNEARTVGTCVAKARAYLARAGIDGEVVVADNGSTDGSQAIATAKGARVVPVPQRGYGAALIAGIRAARGKYVIMGDSDDSYDFSALDGFVAKLREGYQLVMGNRFRGGIEPKAMPPLHRYFGNPFLTAVGRMFFKSSCGDFYCGLRGFDRQSMLDADLQGSGMEFALEMIVKATVYKFRITEVPTTLAPDGRGRPPHLRSWRDGWRSLRFFMLFSPRWLFLYPGAAVFMIGLLASLWLLPGTRYVGKVGLDIHSLLYAAVAVVIGFQSIQFWVFAKIYGMRERIVPPDPWFRSMIKYVGLEVSLIVGLVLMAIGLGLGIYAVDIWSATGLGALRPSETMRLVIPSGTLIILAFQIAYGSFFASVLEIQATRNVPGPDVETEDDAIEERRPQKAAQ
jgi:glycosyltransferase involved in cell wall biosynthesis